MARGEKADHTSGAPVAGASVVHVAILALSPFLLLALLIFLDGLIRP